MRYFFLVAVTMFSFAASASTPEVFVKELGDFVSDFGKKSLEEQVDLLQDQLESYRSELQNAQAFHRDEERSRKHAAGAIAAYARFKTGLDLLKSQGAKTGHVRSESTEFQKNYWQSLLPSVFLFSVALGLEAHSGGGSFPAHLFAGIATVVTAVHALIVTKEWVSERDFRSEVLEEFHEIQEDFKALPEVLSGKALELHKALSASKICDGNLLNALLTWK